MGVCLPTGYGPRPTAYGLLPTAYGLLPTAYGLLPTAYGPRPPGYGLRPTVEGLRIVVVGDYTAITVTTSPGARLFINTNTSQHFQCALFFWLQGNHLQS